MGTQGNDKEHKTLAEEIRKLETEYNNYIDSSEVIMNYYKNQTTSGFDKHFLRIEEWLEQDNQKKDQSNVPLVIEADDGVGKKTLLVKWIDYHNANKKTKYDDIIIPHFTMIGGNNSNYFYAIYRILIKLRELLNISQKVELLEEKLRKYFAYWLDICNNELENQIIHDNKTLYNRIILIFEGANHFTDATSGQQEANIWFWLPQYFPPRIKVIVTVSKNSGAMHYFQTRGLNTLQIKNEASVIETLIENHRKRKSFISNELKENLIKILLKKYGVNNQNVIYFKTYLSLLIPYPSEGIITESDVRSDFIEQIVSQIDLQKIQDIQNLHQFISFMLDYYSEKIISDKKKFIKLLLAFAHTQKGLSVQEIMLVCKVTESEWKLFVAFFKIYLMRFKEYWIINNDLFKSVLIYKYCKDQTVLVELHEEIADQLHKTPNSIRKLEEQTYHLFMAKSYFKLKEIISTIENFLLLFNPNNKYDLCRYWQKLEEQGFDPVIEYNKAIEGFQMQYHPNSEDLFRIIVQVSRFLKDFCDFETYFTPHFRHPPIQGIREEIHDIGLLNELKRMSLCYIIDPVAGTGELKEEGIQENPQEKIAKKIEKIKQKQQKKTKSDQSKQKQENEKLLESKKPSQAQIEVVKPEILTKLEKKNVDIPYNREEVRKFYLDKIGFVQEEKEPENEQDQRYFAQKSTLDGSPTSMRELSIFKYETHLQQPQPLKQHHESVSVKALQPPEIANDHIPTDYYYKRWIWIQFPWACISLQSDYSAKMKQCFAKATEYMSVQEEKAFTRQALKIAIEAKLKKKLMYQKADEMTSTQYKKFEISIISPKQQMDQNSSIMSFMRNPTLRAETLPNNQRNDTLNMTRNSMNKFNKMQSGQFFLTEDQMSLATIQKELDEHLKLKTLPSLKQQQSMDNMNVTQKIIERSRIQKEKTKPFDPALMNDQSSNFILPRLKGSIQIHSNKQLGIMQSQAKQMKKELDDLTYRNCTLVKSLASLKTLQSNEGCGNADVDHVEIARQKIHDLVFQQESVQYQFMLSMVQQERLKIILKICSDNRAYHEEWIRDLNYLLSNLSKLIKYEQEDIYKVQNRMKNIHQTHKQYVVAVNDNLKYSKKMMNEIHSTIKNKEELDSYFEQSDKVIQEQSQLKIKQYQTKQINKQEQEVKMQKMLTLEKNSKAVQDDLEQLRRQMTEVCVYINIREQNYQENNNFINFLNYITINYQLVAKVKEQSDQLSKLTEQKNWKSRKLKTLINANKNEHEIKREKTMKLTKGRVKEDETMQDIKEKRQLLQKALKDKQKQSQKLNMILLDYKISIRNIRNKLQSTTIKLIESQPKISVMGDINSQLVQKQNYIHEKLGQEQFKLFLAGKYDFNSVYRASYEYQQDPLLQSMEPV